MRIRVFEHVPFEGPATLAQWAAEHDHGLEVTRLHAGDAMPASEDFDLLVVLGGPMNIYEDDRYSWLAAEKAAIRAAIDAERRVFGVCLGAQLLADALGAQIIRGVHTEIGWFPVDFTSEAMQSQLFEGFGPSRLAFHWHSDTFGIPSGCVRMASSDACENQAFASENGRLLGVQFHWEYDRASVVAMVEHAADDPVRAPYIQSAERLLEDDERFLIIRDSLWKLLDRFTAPMAVASL